MIISHAWRFIFIKTTKTAGTSIEMALRPYLGRDDIASFLEGRPGQHHLAPISAYRPRDFFKMLRGRRKVRYRQHTAAADIRRWIPSSIWDGYYKWAVVRNPWDRAISSYHWRVKGKKHPDLGIDATITQPEHLDYLQRTSWGLYTIGGEVVVDELIRYENLESDLEGVRRHLGLPEPLSLPRAKGSFRTDHRTYREVLSNETCNRIAEVCGPEIELMGYSLDLSSPP